MHINYYKIVKLLKSFKIIIVASTCFGLHKPITGSSQTVLRRSYNVDFGYIHRYMQLCMWIVHCRSALSSCTVHSALSTRITSYNDVCNRSQHCNFGEAQAESSLMMVFVNRNMLEQLQSGPKKMYTLFTHQYLWNKFKWNFYFRVKV